jgi:hypothetical protein
MPVYIQCVASNRGFLANRIDVYRNGSGLAESLTAISRVYDAEQVWRNSFNVMEQRSEALIPSREDSGTMELANYLRSQRERRAISCTGLATLSGISRMTLWRWENSVCIPHVYELEIALEALSIPTEERNYALTLRAELLSRKSVCENELQLCCR